MCVFVASIMHETNTHSGRTHSTIFVPLGQVVYVHTTRMQSSAVEGIISTLRTAGGSRPVCVCPRVAIRTVANRPMNTSGSLLEDLTGLASWTASAWFCTAPCLPKHATILKAPV